MKEKFKLLFNSLFEQGIILLFSILTVRALDLFFLGGVPFLDLTEVIKFTSIVLVDELKFVFAYLMTIGLILALINLWSRKVFLILFILTSGLVIFSYLATIQYYHTTNILLDHVILFFSFQELKQIAVSETGNLLDKYLLFYLFPIIIFTAALVFKEKIRKGFSRFNIITILLIAVLALSMFLFFQNRDKLTYLGSQIAQSKTKLLIKSIYDYYVNSASLDHIGQEEFVELVRNFRNFMGWEASSFQYRYPLIHNYEENGGDLSRFFNDFDGKPNVVLVYCEGLSSTFSGPNARHGSMTPKLDSIYAQSLYWPNTISNTDRTHGVFANTLASMPHGFERGVLNLKYRFPEHLSVPKVLVSNGYEASFTYGGWAYFDNYEPFLRTNYVENVRGIKFFQDEFDVNLKKEGESFSWGIHDKELFNLYFKLKERDKSKAPFFDILLNLSLHSPFDIPNQEKYIKKAKKQFMEVNGDIDLYEKKKLELSVIAYQDEAIANFLTEYSKRPEFHNTIFVFVGDHSANVLPNKWRIETHHVPLAVFSSNLKKSKTFYDFVAHTDVPISLIAMLKPYLDLSPLSKQSHWLGYGLTTTNKAQAKHPIFIGRFNGDIVGVLNSDTLLMDNTLYLLNKTFQPTEINDESQKKYLSQRLNEYKVINRFVLKNNRLFLDEDALLFPNDKADFFFPEN